MEGEVAKLEKGNIMKAESTTQQKIVTYNDIFKGLKKLNLPKNPVLLVHSSLKSFGYVEGGPATVIKALIDTCGDEGTLVMPTLTFGSVDEEEPFFDAAETPSGTGLITEVFRKMPGVRRSLHLFSSAAAFGAKADYITSYHNDTPCGPGTPYQKVIELEGYILFIGAGFGSNTLFHVAEEYANPPYMRYKTIKDTKIKDLDGNTYIKTLRRYDCYQTGIIRKLVKMEEVFEKENVLTRTIIGNSNITLISAEDNFKISCALLKNNYTYILE